jgi:predicted TPR repeat methyltransferase
VRPAAPPFALRAALETAVEHLREGRDAAALTLLGAVLAEHPGQPDALHLLGIVHHEQGSSAEAERSLRAAIERWPRGDAALAGVWNNLGNVLLESGELAAADDAYRAGLALDPDASRTWANLAVLSRRRGRLDDALDAARGAVRTDPDDAHGWFTLSRVLIEHGDVPEGLRANAEATARAPRDAVGRDQVLRALVLLGRRAEAADLYRQWLAEEPDDPVARHQLAACEQLAVPARASDAYVEAVFDQFAASFDAKLAMLDYRAPELIADALTSPRLDRPSWGSVADLGCGTGLLGRRLRERAKRLVGVDLSVAMLHEADRRGVYDALFKVELLEFLRHEPGRFDTIVGADVLCYFGELDEFAGRAAASLTPGGVLAFTTEALAHGAEQPWELTTTGRYAHRGAYVERVLVDAGLVHVEIRADVLRREAGAPVAGAVVTARRPG